MTLAKKLSSCLFALVLGASLAFLPVAAFADDAPADKGVADQFASADDEAAADEAAADEAVETASTQQQSASGTYVIDQYGLFSADQRAALEQKAEQLADQYGISVYVLTTDLMNGNYNPTSSECTAYVKEYHDSHGLAKDALVLALAVDSRDYVTVGFGEGAEEFTASGIESMEDDVTDYLHDDDWYGGANAYYGDIGAQLGYFAEHGKAGQPLSMMDYVIRIVIILVIPLVIALMVTGSWKRAMLTAREKTEAHDYLDQSSLVLTVSTDTFINSSVIATPRADDRKSSGGGGWGGGGGFASSGGGKF